MLTIQYMSRHYTDVLLVAVVALCTVENDVIHAAYLAIALLLFRRRDALRTERQALFRWLPLYNFAVMAVTLAYQAPFNAAWDRSLRPYLVRHLCGNCTSMTRSAPIRPSEFQRRLWNTGGIKKVFAMGVCQLSSKFLIAALTLS